MKTTITTGEELDLFLQNVDQMVICQRHCCCEFAKVSLQTSIGIEAQLLVLKLETVKARWANYLPLHELKDFDFEKWKWKIGIWLQTLEEDYCAEVPEQYEEFIPSSEYLFDLYGMVMPETPVAGEGPTNFYDRGSDTDLQEDTRQYVKRVGHMIKNLDMIKDQAWLKELIGNAALDRLKQEQQEGYHEVAKEDRSCVRVLGNLLMVLTQLQDLTSTCQPSEMFQRLSTRIYYHLCTESHRKAIKKAIELKNIWPEGKVIQNAMREKEKTKAILLKKWEEYGLAEYVDLDNPTLIDDAQFGRFLYKNRQELSRDDICSLHYNCRLILQLNKIMEDEQPVAASASARCLTDVELGIWNRLSKLIHRPGIPWCNITADQVELVMAQALGIRLCPHVDVGNAMTQKLWSLFKCRPKCDEAQSQKVTWLNIVGFLKRKCYLEGTSPKLLKAFYPNEEPHLYNNITKGFNATQKNFEEVVPLLERCLVQLNQKKSQ